MELARIAGPKLSLMVRRAFFPIQPDRVVWLGEVVRQKLCMFRAQKIIYDYVIEWFCRDKFRMQPRDAIVGEVGVECKWIGFLHGGGEGLFRSGCQPGGGLYGRHIGAVVLVFVPSVPR